MQSLPLPSKNHCLWVIVLAFWIIKLWHLSDLKYTHKHSDEDSYIFILYKLAEILQIIVIPHELKAIGIGMHHQMKTQTLFYQTEYILHIWHVSCPSSKRTRGWYHCVTENFFWNTQLMSMIIFYVFLAAESDSDICFPPSRLDFAAHEVTIFRKQ